MNNKKIFYSTRRSGSTLFSRSLYTYGNVIAHANRLRFGLAVWRGSKPDYGYYSHDTNSDLIHNCNATIVNKENFGELPSLLGGIQAALYSILPASYEQSSKIISQVQPVLYIRNPINTANSLLKANMGSLHGFMKSYENAFENYRIIQQYDNNSLCVTHEAFIAHTEEILYHLFEYRNIAPNLKTIQHDNIYSFERIDERILYRIHFNSKNHNTLKKHKAIKKDDIIETLVLSDHQIQSIEREFLDDYNALHHKTLDKFGI